jgi:hypothetical protein
MFTQIAHYKLCEKSKDARYYCAQKIESTSKMKIRRQNIPGKSLFNELASIVNVLGLLCKACNLHSLFEKLKDPTVALNVIAFLRLDIQLTVSLYRDYEETLELAQKQERFLADENIWELLRSTLTDDRFGEFFSADDGETATGAEIIKDSLVILTRPEDIREIPFHLPPEFLQITRSALKKYGFSEDVSAESEMRYMHGFLINMLGQDGNSLKHGSIREWFLQSGMEIIAPVNREIYLRAKVFDGNVHLERISRYEHTAVDWNKTLLLCKVGSVLNT